MNSDTVEGALMVLSGVGLLVASIVALVIGEAMIGVFGLIILLAVGKIALDRLLRNASD